MLKIRHAKNRARQNQGTPKKRLVEERHVGTWAHKARGHVGIPGTQGAGLIILD